MSKYAPKELNEEEAEACEKFYREPGGTGVRSCDMVAHCMRQELGRRIAVQRVQMHLKSKGLLRGHRENAGYQAIKGFDRAAVMESISKNAR